MMTGWNACTDRLRCLVEGIVLSSPGETGGTNWWRKPLLVTARADERFHALPRIASEGHLLPQDLLPTARTVVVFFLPFAKGLLDENTPGKFPCRSWGLAYEATNDLIRRISERIQGFFADQGYRSALTPATHNFDPVRLVARWSHKHLGYLCGLGRFGMNAQLITPAGCAGRLGSVVTEADLGDHSLVGSEELCRHRAGRECLQCLDRCPVRALGKEGIDRQRCFTRLKVHIQHSHALAGLEKTTQVCGKCVVGLPCSFDPGNRKEGGAETGERKGRDSDR